MLDFSAPPLRDAIATDVCIIGGGVTGLTTACLLADAGLSVTVLESGACGGGETLRSTAQLSSRSDHGLVRLERRIESRRARLAAQSHAAAIDWMETFVHAEDIKCGFRRLDAYLLPGEGGRYDDLLEEMLAAQRAGLDAAFVTATPSVQVDARQALRFRGQAQLNPARYLHGLLAAMRRRARARVSGQTRVVSIEPGSPVRVVTADGGTVAADTVAVATNRPANVGLRLPHAPASFRTYALAAELPAGAASEPALYWDTDDPPHHVRILPGRDTPDAAPPDGHTTSPAPPDRPVPR